MTHHHNRGTWNNKADFVLALISYGVGLGNVWRFDSIITFFKFLSETYKIAKFNLFDKNR